MRQGNVYVGGVLVGVISETDSGFVFSYDEQYMQNAEAMPVSITLPLNEKDYYSKTLFSFFDGLIPEGWLLNIAERNRKVNRRDRMGLLLACCRDCIGNVSVIPLKKEGRNERLKN